MPDHARSGCPSFVRASIGRRQALRVGVLGALGLSTGELFRRRALAGEGGRSPAATSVIQIHLPGGLAQQESWDPKPEAAAEYRGPFGVVKTRLPGVAFSENLARMAAIADKVTILRAVVGKIPDHGQATYHLFTGYTPSTVIDYPQMGAVVSRAFGPRKDLPPYVAVPRLDPMSGGSGYMSSKYAAFELGSDPGEPNYKVRDFAPPPGVDADRLARRRAGRNAVEGRFRGLEADLDQLDTMDEFHGRAYKLITSPHAQRAFSLDDEPAATFARYGEYTDPRNRQKTPIGRRLILARRLVEAGVRFVTVNYGAFDSHARLKDDCQAFLPAFDHALAALITDLEARGLLETTLVMVTTEFGRTPKINSTDGRDHWARVYSMVLAGGGITRGHVLGASDATAAEPASDGVPLEDVLHTVYHQIGINADDRPMAPGDRPIDIIRGGKLIKPILA